MQIQVSARHTTVRDGDRQLIVDKIDRLAKYLPGMEFAEIHFSAERNPRIADKEVCEVTLEGHGHHVRCTANGPDHITAVDRAIAKLENKLHKLKTKLARKPSHRDITKAKLWAQGGTELPVDELISSNGSVATLDVDDEFDLADDTAGGDAVVAAEKADYTIVRSKKVEKLALSPLEAALRMDLVSHDFYFFTNIETGRGAVVYQRHDGDIGLIDEID